MYCSAKRVNTVDKNSWSCQFYYLLFDLCFIISEVFLFNLLHFAWIFFILAIRSTLIVLFNKVLN